MAKIEELTQYVIVNKETKEVWSDEVYLSKAGAKNSFRHATCNWNNPNGVRFNDQTKFIVVAVKIVPIWEKTID